MKAKKDSVLVCPARLLQGRKVFLDCIHLLTLHEPGNDLHVVSEVKIPGGTIDYFLVSARQDKVCDFVGIELQTLDTTGTVWPARQQFLQAVGVPVSPTPNKNYNINWKMTAKTILIQLHHKIQTFENLNKHLVLVVQDQLMTYRHRQFTFGHVSNPARIGDSMHFHVYEFKQAASLTHTLQLNSRLSTDEAGVAACLGKQAEAAVETETIISLLEKKISDRTKLTL